MDSICFSDLNNSIDRWGHIADPETRKRSKGAGFVWAAPLMDSARSGQNYEKNYSIDRFRVEWAEEVAGAGAVAGLRLLRGPPWTATTGFCSPAVMVGARR